MKSQDLSENQNTPMAEPLSSQRPQKMEEQFHKKETIPMGFLS